MNKIKFEVGDKVWSPICGNGVVEKTEGSVSEYPIVVITQFGKIIFTTDGKLHWNHPQRSLYRGHDLKIIGEVMTITKWILYYKSGSTSTYNSKRQAEHDAGPFDQVIEVNLEVRNV